MASRTRKTQTAPTDDQITIAILKDRIDALEAENAALREALTLPAAPPAPPAPKNFASRLRDIARTCEQSGGSLRIVDIKAGCPDMDTADVDRYLIALQKAEKIVLYSYTAPWFVTPEVKAAATMVAGEPRHTVYSKSSSWNNL
ncbi:MAG: hypothetical protein LBT40_12200 [Deltaproteobacteria bacterium]|jgi:hypothetical protein|nr:hypothetical protein [Deltaproteobacteria bacterium]